MNIFSGYLVGTLAFSSIFMSPEAQSEEATCRNKTVIYYGNGILSTDDDRDNALDNIQTTLFSHDSMSQEKFDSLEFVNAHNESGGALKDAIETSTQLLLIGTSRFYRLISEIEPIPDVFQEAAERISTDATLTFLRESQDLKTHVTNYIEDINQDKNVIVVAHSQGNLFVNQAYELIPNNLRDRFRIVSVATPDSIVGGNGPHTTLHEDFVILGLRQALGRIGQPAPLEANHFNFVTPDLLGHNFVRAYINPNETSSVKITEDIIDAIDSFPVDTCVEPGDVFINFSNPVVNADDRPGWNNEFVDQGVRLFNTYSLGLNPFGTIGQVWHSAFPFLFEGIDTKIKSITIDIGNNSPTPYVKINGYNNKELFQSYPDYPDYSGILKNTYNIPISMIVEADRNDYYLKGKMKTVEFTLPKGCCDYVTVGEAYQHGVFIDNINIKLENPVTN